jgi:hypothetical protein
MLGRNDVRREECQTIYDVRQAMDDGRQVVAKTRLTFWLKNVIYNGRGEPSITATFINLPSLLTQIVK